MNLIDGIILGVLLLSVLVGLFRGLVSEVLSLVIWIVAFWAAWMFGATVVGQLEHAISVPSLRYLAAYGGVFVAVLILGALVRFAVRRLIWSAGLSGVDRVFGMVFGLVRGVLIVTVLVFLVGLTALTRESWWQQSVLLPQFQSAAAWLGQQIPPDVANNVREKLDPSTALQKVKPADVIDHLRDLPVPLDALKSGGVAPMPATSRNTAIPAPATSAAPHSSNY